MLLRHRPCHPGGLTHFAPQARGGLGGFGPLLVGGAWLSALSRLCDLRAVGRKARRRLRGGSWAGPCGGFCRRLALGHRGLLGHNLLGLAGSALAFARGSLALHMGRSGWGAVLGS